MEIARNIYSRRHRHLERIAQWFARLNTTPTGLRLDRLNTLKMLLRTSESVYVEEGSSYTLSHEGDWGGSILGFLGVRTSVVRSSSRLLRVCHRLYDEGILVLYDSPVFTFSGHRPHGHPPKLRPLLCP